jgi:hypothetical protein
MTKWLLVALASAMSLAAQGMESIDVTGAGKDPRWKIAGRTVSVADEKGKHAVKISEGPGMGVVWLDGYDFSNGSIEIDLLGRSQPVQGSFLGVAFHVADSVTHEAVYFRPFNFRAEDADRHSHAVQYVSHPQWPWQPLRTEHPGEYEHAVIPEPDGDQWFHVRIDVQRPQVSVYVNGEKAPCLTVKELGERTHGPIGLWVGEGSGGYFANLRVKKQ